MVICNGLGVHRNSRQVSPGGIAYVPGRCTVFHFMSFDILLLDCMYPSCPATVSAHP